MRCALSTVTTRRSWLISFTVRVFGTSTSMPDWRIGAVIMKIMSSTRTTSTNGTMLISESEVCVDLESCGMAARSLKFKVESRKQEKIEQRDAKPIARPGGQAEWFHEC